jgi:hypothetical protein
VKWSDLLEIDEVNELSRASIKIPAADDLTSIISG